MLQEKTDNKLYPSRILNLGIYKIISKAQDLKSVNEVEMNKIISNIYENLNDGLLSNFENFTRIVSISLFFLYLELV